MGIFEEFKKLLRNRKDDSRSAGDPVRKKVPVEEAPQPSSADLIRQARSAKPIGPAGPVSVEQLALSSDGRYLAASICGFRDMAVTVVWDVKSNKRIGVYASWTNGMIPGTDLLKLRSLVSGGAVRNRISERFVSVEAKRVVKKLKGYPNSSPPGKSMQSWTSTGRVRFWDHEFTKTEVRLPGAKNIQQVAVSSDCGLIATADYSERITLWDGKTGEKKFEFKHPAEEMVKWGCQFGFHAERPWLWAVRGSGLLIWDTSTAEQLEEIDLEEEVGGDPYPSPDGRFVVFDKLEKDSELAVVGLESGRVVRKIPVRPKNWGLRFTPDCKGVFVAGREGCGRFDLESESGRMLSRGDHWSADMGGKLFATGTIDGRILCFDHQSLETVKEFEFPEQ